MVAKDQIYDRMLNMMNTYSFVLQGYRSILSTMQTVLFAVGVYVLSTPLYLLIIPLAMLGVLLSVVWWYICKFRAHDERYFQWRAIRLENKEIYPSGDVIRGVEQWRPLDDGAKLAVLVQDYLAWQLLRGESLEDRRERINKWLNLGYQDPRWWMDHALPFVLGSLWVGLGFGYGVYLFSLLIILFTG